MHLWALKAVWFALAGHDMGGQGEGATHAVCQPAEAEAGARPGASSEGLFRER